MPEEGVDESKRSTLRRFAAIGAASPLARFQSDGTSDSDAPDAIAGYVAATPGAHFSKLRDDLQLGTGEAQHHLRRLVRAGVVESRKDGDYRRYFPADRFSEFEQVALGYLRRETPRGMLVALLRDPALTAGGLADRLGVSTPTISKYGSELETAGLLSRADGYAVERPETIMLLLVRYADSFGSDAAALAAEADTLLSYDG
ncbi:winged helix-turn-helix transcriptional regulator [Halorientalis regularis]|jgi:predicted transcriptional regulator|uniref:Predicted transcriptional regulator, containsd two HTH domains n=1 Tax=Halorientalis regularis TaxID=660518 RepID=A0A1G7J8K5_9EURY|nr:winged helix-turn-helix transcriptional regulator [Halorientalis regularis]SDF21114.1 Predicted transcriptional regulator, containsd two HTH domains [Halorientalis regularis]